MKLLGHLLYENKGALQFANDSAANRRTVVEVSHLGYRVGVEGLWGVPGVRLVLPFNTSPFSG